MIECPMHLYLEVMLTWSMRAELHWVKLGTAVGPGVRAELQGGPIPV